MDMIIGREKFGGSGSGSPTLPWVKGPRIDAVDLLLCRGLRVNIKNIAFSVRFNFIRSVDKCKRLALTVDMRVQQIRRKNVRIG